MQPSCYKIAVLTWIGIFPLITVLLTVFHRHGDVLLSIEAKW